MQLHGPLSQKRTGAVGKGFPLTPHSPHYPLSLHLSGPGHPGAAERQVRVLSFSFSLHQGLNAPCLFPAHSPPSFLPISLYYLLTQSSNYLFVSHVIQEL